MHELEIVIVTWNSARDIERCLRSIALVESHGPWHVTVVDNASEDGTPERVRESFPDVRLICNAENRGFAAANNQALRETGSPYWMLLNPDTEVVPGAVEELLGFMAEHPAAAVAGPLLVNADGSAQHPGQKFPTLLNLLWETLFLDRLFPRSVLFGAHRGMRRTPERPEPVEIVHGAAMVVRRSAAETIGLLDEGYFMYFEEVDWCHRFLRAGLECWLVPSARIIHHGGVDLGHYDADRLLHYHRSLLRFFARQKGRTGLLRLLIGFRSLIRVVVWALAGLAQPRLRAAAASSIRGYAKVLGLLFSEVAA